MNNRQFPLIDFEVDDFTPPWRPGPAPTVLLHPGLGGNARLYSTWVPFLADRYRVIRVTARGQGGTPKPEDFERSLENFVQDVMDVLNHLAVEKIHWVGASGGGIMGQYAALSRPERLKSLSLIATTARFRGPTNNYDDWLAPLDQGNQYEFLERDAERRFGVENPERTNWIIQELCRTGAAESAAMHRWVHGINLIDRLPEIGCPTLIVTGQRDTLTDLDDASVLADRIPDSCKRILPGLPHNIAYTHPREVSTVVREFLDEIEGDHEHGTLGA
jgi:3-oxoadipate enol-lactonase